MRNVLGGLLLVFSMFSLNYTILSAVSGSSSYAYILLGLLPIGLAVLLFVSSAKSSARRRAYLALHGTEPGRICPRCKGIGASTVVHMYDTPCSSCDGTGWARR